MIVMTYMNASIKQNRKNIFLFLSILLTLTSVYISFLIMYSNKNKDIFYISSDEIYNCYMAKEAPKDGSLGLWYYKEIDNVNKSSYYICHDYGEIGKKVLKARKNDYFTIDDKKYQIFEILKVRKDSYFEQIKNKVILNSESASIQVCIPFTSYNRIIIAKNVK